MKRQLTLLSIGLALTTNLLAVEAPTVPTVTGAPKLVEIGLKSAFVPIGFDDNDRSQFVVQGTLPSTCYRIGPYKMALNQENKIVVTQQAYYYQGVCLQIQTPFTQTIQAGLMKEGAFEVMDGTSGQTLGKLLITRSKNAGPDDYLYAPIGDAFVSTENGQPQLTITGQFSDRCSSIEEIKVRVQEDRVIVVQPVMKREEALGCVSAATRFSKVTPLPTELKGLYLLHVRSLDGQAINKMVDVE